jgi:protein kinase A
MEPHTPRRQDSPIVSLPNADGAHLILVTRPLSSQVEHTISEKNVLFCMKSNFMVGLYDYFTDSKNLYFLLEFVNGGEMFTHIQKQKRRCFDADSTKFYAAEAVLAFERVKKEDE